MKCPNRRANLPDTAPFPHEYAREAEYLLRMMEYNMRVYMLAMIGAAENMPADRLTSPRMVLMLAIQNESERVSKTAKEALGSEINVASMLGDLNIPTQD